MKRLCPACSEETEHWHCAWCGFRTDPSELCPSHHAISDLGWAQVNRAMCDFLHRKSEPPSPPAAPRDEQVSEAASPDTGAS